MDIICLGSTEISIEYDEPFAKRLELIFEDRERLAAESYTFQSGDPTISMRLRLLANLPQKPTSSPIYRESLSDPSSTKGTLAIYSVPKGKIFYFGNEAYVRLQQSGELDSVHYEIRAIVTPRLLQSGRLEDVIFTSLAPILRRIGIFLTHAFSVTHGRAATLFVGPSGSGKTTSGLALIAAGWGYLANDVTMLQCQKSQIFSLATPGGIGISEKTAEIIPGLRDLWNSTDKSKTAKRLYFPAKQVVGGWADNSPISRICFPEISSEDDCHLEPLGKAVSLAKLMENSVDHWDQDYLSKHISLLETLCQQSQCLKLVLGRNVDQLPNLLAN